MDLFGKKRYKIKAKNRKKLEKYNLPKPWTEGSRTLDFKSSEDSYQALQYAKIKYQDIDFKEVIMDHLAGSNNFNLTLQLKMVDFTSLSFLEKNKLKAQIILKFIISKFNKK